MLFAAPSNKPLSTTYELSPFSIVQKFIFPPPIKISFAFIKSCQAVLARKNSGEKAICDCFISFHPSNEIVLFINIGTLGSLDIDNINLNGSSITISGGGLNISTVGDISINSQKITGVVDPTATNGVATKNYVDNTIDAENIGLQLDITGLSNPNTGGVGNGPINDVISILNLLYPASSKNGSILLLVFKVSKLEK